MKNTMEIVMKKMEIKFGKTETSKNNSVIDAMIKNMVKTANEKRGKNV